ncbi:hypothetical protein ACFL3V_02360 [Nanoarchaeota archaeon]
MPYPVIYSMYSCQRLLKLITRMEKEKSELRITNLAKEEYEMITALSEKILAIAHRLTRDRKISHLHLKHISDFRNQISYVQFALEDIVKGRTNRTMPEKVAGLKKSVITYEDELKILEEELGEDLEHVREEVKTMEEELKHIETLGISQE